MKPSLSMTIPGLPTVRWNGKGMKEADMVHPTRWIDAYFTAVVA
ncbi:hypothetical protein [Vibrio cidicii]|nr:hypothetical protein [Vibrio cidicii]